MKPLVTAVCPIVGRIKYIPGLIDCFLNQTFDDSELLIVEDGGDEVTEYLATTLLQWDTKIRYKLFDGSRMPTGMKRNVTNGFARGEIIIHMDSDDWHAPNYIADSVEHLQRSGKQVVGYHDILYYRESDGGMFKYRFGGEAYASGASQCYWRTYWREHPFKHIIVGSDAQFALDAAAAGVLASEDCKGRVVCRNLADSVAKPNLGDNNFPPCSREEFPQAFLDTLNGEGI